MIANPGMARFPANLPESYTNSRRRWPVTMRRYHSKRALERPDRSRIDGSLGDAGILVRPFRPTRRCVEEGDDRQNQPLLSREEGGAREKKQAAAVEEACKDLLAFVPRNAQTAAVFNTFAQAGGAHNSTVM